MNKVRVLKQNEIENKENEVVLSIVNTTDKVAFKIDKDLIAQKVLFNFTNEFKHTTLIGFEDFLQKYTYKLSCMLTANITTALLILFNIYDNPNLSAQNTVDNINTKMTEDIETFIVSIRNREIMLEMISLYKKYLGKLEV